MKVRIKFSKKGVMKFIGHLDIMRYFQKAIRRSGFPICYSTGYSPHQIMSFAAPLGVGLESEGEYFDVESKELESTEIWLERLNATMAEGMQILDIRILPDDVKNAMASVYAAGYRIDWIGGQEYDFIDEIEMLLQQNEVFIDKETKKGIIQRDIRPLIYLLKPTSNGGIEMIVNASSSDNVKPSAILDVLLSFHHKGENRMKFQITRTECYTKESDKMIPLMDMGMRL